MNILGEKNEEGVCIMNRMTLFKHMWSDLWLLGHIAYPKIPFAIIVLNMNILPAQKNENVYITGR